MYVGWAYRVSRYLFLLLPPGPPLALTEDPAFALTYISGNSLGNLTPRSTFSVWKFPWKYDLLWRQNG